MLDPDSSINKVPPSPTLLQGDAASLADGIFANILEHMLNGVAYCRMLFKDGSPYDFLYLYANTALHSQTGLGPVSGKLASEIIPSIRDSNPRLFEIYARVAAGGAPEKLETLVEPLQQWFSVQVFSPKPEHFVAVFDVVTERKQAENALAISENRFRRISSLTSDLIYSCCRSDDGIFRFDWVGGNARNLFGHDAEELKSLGCWQFFVVPEDQPLFASNITELQPDQLSDVILHVRHRDGTLRYLRSIAQVEADSTCRGNDRLYGTLQDVTEHKQAEDALRLSASVFANSYEAIIITDENNIIVDANPAFTRITGYTREEIIGKSPGVFASGHQDAEFYGQMWKSLQKHDYWRGEIWNRRKNGEVYAEMLAISIVRDSDGKLQHYIAIFSDISLLKAHEAELDHIAHYDSLTGAPNRRLLADRLDQAIARSRRNGKPLAICYLDLDGFKSVNDEYGHTAGDRLLIEIAERFKDVLRAEDTLARLGGDEFVLLLSDLAQPEESQFVLDRILTAVSTPVQIKNAPVSISASIGVTLFPADDVDAATLLRHADQAMYRAKEAGKNRYQFFDPDQDRQLQAHHYHLQRLREALENKEFVLHYQPKVDLISGDVVGAEALIRWQYPEQGLLPPSEFLHAMIGSDLEIAIGEWVINSVLEQISAWNSIGLSLTVSANISADHLLQKGFAERLRLILEHHADVSPRNLELEILETAALGDMKQAVHTLNRCRRLGVHFALDDFGTGYSSLTYFRRLPVDTLKIDQSFVRDMLDDPDDLSIVESVVRLASVFNRLVVAEGAHTLEHGAMLIHLGCRFAQGYGIAHPMPAEQMPGWVGQWRSKALWTTMNDRFSAREDLTLLVAAKSHSKWIDKIMEHLKHPETEISISLDGHHCPFGRWYHGSGAARYGEIPEFQAIAPLHEHAHKLGPEMIAMVKSGQIEAARKRLPELNDMRDSMLKQLDRLVVKAAVSSM